MKTIIRVLPLLAVILLAEACRPTVEFDPEKRQEVVNSYSPADTIDANHDWTLTKKNYVQLKVNVPKADSVQLLSENPYQSAQAELLMASHATPGQTLNMDYMVKKTQQTIYAMAFDIDSTTVEHRAVPLALTSFTFGSHNADFTNELSMEGNYNAPGEQRVYYCFENTYPEPFGDWDYNDVVLSMTRANTGNPRTVRLSVKLEAAGTDEQAAAAIRLVGVTYESVSVELKGSFFPKFEFYHTLITDPEILQKSVTTDEAVIALFDDVHLAFRPRLNAQGMVTRGYFNTSRESKDDYWIFASPSVDYYITFGSEAMARSFTLADIDPFILKNYYNTAWEIHTYPYKTAEVLYKNYNGKEAEYNKDHLSWALAVPYAWFRYPLEGTSLGYHRDGVFSGAYMTLPHAFGQWVMNREEALDWYLYPTSSSVY